MMTTHQQALHSLRKLCIKARLTPDALSGKERRRLALNVAVVLPRLSEHESLSEQDIELLLQAEQLLFVALHSQRYENVTGRHMVEVDRAMKALMVSEKLRLLLREGKEGQARAYVHSAYQKAGINAAVRDKEDSSELPAKAKPARERLCCWSGELIREQNPEELALAQESAWRVPEEASELLEVVRSDEAIKARGERLLHLLSLPKRQRETWALKYILRWSAKEIAEELGMNSEAVNMSNFHARVTLRGQNDAS